MRASVQPRAWATACSSPRASSRCAIRSAAPAMAIADAQPASALRGEDIFRPGDPARRRAALAEDRLRDGVIAQVLALHAQRVAMGQTELFERHRLFDFGHG